MACVRRRVLPRSGDVRWVVEYRDGKDSRRFKQFVRKRDAEAFLHQTVVDVAGGQHVSDASTTTVSDAAKLWLEHLAVEVEAGTLEAITVVTYESQVRVHLLNPEIGIGATKLNRLTTGAVLAFRDRLLQHNSAAMTRKVLTTLSTLVSFAVQRELTAVNHVKRVKVRTASRHKKKVVPPSKEVIAKLIAKAHPDFRALLNVAAFTGLRASELYALRWANVDFRNNRIQVRERLDRLRQIGPPKSAAGERDVPMGSYVRQTLLRLAADRSHELVFHNGAGNPLNHSNVRYRWFAPACEAAGVQMRFHDLRHFAVSLWVSQNFGPKAVQNFAGHSSISTTFDIYSHLFPEPESHHAAMTDAETAVLSLQQTVTGTGPREG